MVTEGFIVNPIGPPPATWLPGAVPYRLMAIQPDVSSATLQRFLFGAHFWLALRNPQRGAVTLDMNTGSVVQPLA